MEWRAVHRRLLDHAIITSRQPHLMCWMRVARRQIERRDFVKNSIESARDIVIDRDFLVDT